MSLKKKILRQLQEREGKYVSGQALAECFGVSRAAVWKAVAALKKEGYALSGAPKVGYLLSPSDVLDEAELLADLQNAGFVLNAYVFPTLSSTNAYAEKLLGEGLDAPALIAADEQTQARARRNRSFPSGSGGLYMSLVFFPDLPPEKTAAVSERVYRAVHAVLGGERRENEIFHGGKLLCGILTQYVSDPDRIKNCIAGIGVYPDRLPDQTRQTYPTRNALCAAICKSVLLA